MMKIKDYGSVDWNKILIYDETSPSFLRWRSNRYVRSNGNVAGTKFNTKGIEYYRIKFNKKMWQAHRVIYCMHNGSINKDLVVDHIDGDSTNNNISNLRLIEQSKNVRNSKKRVDSSNITQGVRFQTINNNLYCSCVVNVENKKTITKTYSVKKYGLIPAFAMACKFRKEIMDKLNEYGFGYTERHGK